MRDILEDAGYLTLGSRLKRLGERLQAETQKLLTDQAAELPVALHPYLLALDTLGPLRISDLASALGQSQPGATRAAKALETSGLASGRDSENDRRARVLELTPRGRAFVATCRRGAWAQVEKAARDICAGLDGSLLDQLTALEIRLSKAPLRSRGGQAESAPT